MGEGGVVGGDTRAVLGGGLLHVNAAASLGGVVLHDGAADEGARLQVEAATLLGCLVVLHDAVAYVGIASDEGSGTAAARLVVAAGVAVLDEQAVKHGTVVLTMAASRVVGIDVELSGELILVLTIHDKLLLGGEEVLGKGDDAEDVARRARLLVDDDAAQAGGIGQHVARLVAERRPGLTVDDVAVGVALRHLLIGVAAPYLHATGHDEGVFQQVLLLLGVGDGGARRGIGEAGLHVGVVAGQLHDDGAVLQPGEALLHGGGVERLASRDFTVLDGGEVQLRSEQLLAEVGPVVLVVRVVGGVEGRRVDVGVVAGGILPATGGIEHLLQLHGAGGILGCAGRGQTAATVLRDVEDGLPLLAQVGLNVLRAVVLVGTNIYLAVLNTVGIRHVVVRKDGSRYALVKETAVDLSLSFSLMTKGGE